jgi:hypothetical protein
MVNNPFERRFGWYGSLKPAMTTNRIARIGTS